jgi:hypothetical protein
MGPLVVLHRLQAAVHAASASISVIFDITWSTKRQSERVNSRITRNQLHVCDRHRFILVQCSTCDTNDICSVVFAYLVQLLCSVTSSPVFGAYIHTKYTTYIIKSTNKYEQLWGDRMPFLF